MILDDTCKGFLSKINGQSEYINQSIYTVEEVSSSGGLANCCDLLEGNTTTGLDEGWDYNDPWSAGVNNDPNLQESSLKTPRSLLISSLDTSRGLRILSLNTPRGLRNSSLNTSSGLRISTLNTRRSQDSLSVFPSTILYSYRSNKKFRLISYKHNVIGKYIVIGKV